MSSSDAYTVDVVLPTHRRPHTLGYAIRSVLAQSHQALRLHIVGDGCDAETEAVASSFRDPRVTFYRLPKASGFGYGNRNVVLRELTGRYVAYMNDDDLLLHDHLATAVGALQSGIELVLLRSCAVTFPTDVDPHFFAFTWKGLLAPWWLRPWFFGSVNCVHERRLFDRVGYWNDSLSRFGDREFVNRSRRTASWHYVDQITILRFYALHWDGQYSRMAVPPQSIYFLKVGDRAWIESLRRAATLPCSWRSRRRQIRDFVQFGVRSGPRFIRFCWEQLTSAGAATPRRAAG